MPTRKPTDPETTPSPDAAPLPRSLIEKAAFGARILDVLVGKPYQTWAAASVRISLILAGGAIGLFWLWLKFAPPAQTDNNAVRNLACAVRQLGVTIERVECGQTRDANYCLQRHPPLPPCEGGNP